MLDGITNTLTAPLTLLRSTLTGAFGGLSSVLSGGVGSAISGGIWGVAAGAIATVFLPDIAGVLRNAGKPEWASALTSYMHANPHFGMRMLHAAGLGAVAGGVLGGGSALVSHVQEGFRAVPPASADPARNNARADAQVQNVGHTIGSVAVVGAAAVAGVALYKAVTGKDLFASNTSAVPPATAVGAVNLPELPAARMQAAEVNSPDRPLSVANAQVSVGSTLVSRG